MELNLANLFEGVAAAFGERIAIVAEGTHGTPRRFTYAQLNDRANRLAAVLHAHGLRAGDHVGCHLYNGTEYVEAMLAAFKLRAVPINVNFRYVADELGYLFDDADIRMVITEPDLVATVNQVASLPTIERGDDYEARLAEASSEPPPSSKRSGDDLYVLYTGGTTGKPKGVMWRHEDLLFAALNANGNRRTGQPPLTVHTDMGEWAGLGNGIDVRSPLCPLIHGGAQWIALQSMLVAGTLVLSTDRRYDPAATADLLQTTSTELIMVIGDAVVRPLVDELERRPRDLSSMKVIANGGALLSPAVKSRIEELVPSARVVDSYGASEVGGQGHLRPAKGGDAPQLATIDETTIVVDDDLNPVRPGSGTVGRLARRGRLPIGYYKDPEKTAETFPVVNDERWAVPGDMATVEADGTIIVLGRGSMSINTGGEKVFPEEVEGVLKAHSAVFDAIVVGRPDERFGERVVAVIEARPQTEIDEDDVISHCRVHLSGYKIPRELRVVDRIERLPTGKADYRWAKKIVSD